MIWKLKYLMAPEGDTNGGGAEKAAAEKAAADKAAADKAAADKAADKKPPDLLADTEKTKEGVKAEADKNAPSEIKITVPKDFTIDQKRLDGFVAFAKENKVSPENAQKFFDQYVEQQKADAEAAQLTRAETITGWAEDAKKTFGKDFDATIANAKRALRALGDDETVKVLTESGLGNHKSVLKLLAAAGAKIVEDKLPKDPGSPNSGKRTADEKMRAMYNKSPEMFPSDQK
jgi:hypothetical protein